MTKSEQLTHSKSLKFFYPFIVMFAWCLFALFGAPMKAKNKRNVPKKGGLLIFANHLSNTDPILVQYACPRLVNFMARRELFSMGFLGKLISWFKAFPITQSTADKESLKTAIELVNAGHAVVVFPEGQLSPDGKLIDLLPGASLLIKRTGARCICVGLKNTNKLMPHPTTQFKWAGTSLTAKWGETKQFDKKTSADEMMIWIEAELLSLSDQPPRDSS